MKLRHSAYLRVFLALLLVLTTSGVWATWQYYLALNSASADLSFQVNEFTYGPEEIVYISHIEVAQNNHVPESAFERSYPTAISIKSNVTQIGGSVTYRISVHNNTDVTQWYLGERINLAYGSNALIGTDGGVTLLTKDKQGDTYSTFDEGDWIPPRTVRDFYFTVTYGSATVGEQSLLVDFHFGMRVSSFQDEFLRILNDKESENGYYYLSGVFNEKYAEDKSTVIGNVGDDEAVFDRLFGENLTLEVNGVETPVTVMVERKNVDGRSTGDSYNAANGPTGCEYTVYVTVDPLDSPTGKAMVYAISYSCGADGVWYQIGQLYEGTANIVDYDTSDNVYQGAFDVSSWRATPNTYVVADGIEYKVAQTNGTQYDLLKTITEIMSAGDQEIFNKVDNSGLLKKVYDILRTNQHSDAPEIVNLRAAFEAAAPYYNNFNNGQEFKIKRECTRAELLPYLEHIATALEYYYQVHG